MKKKILVTLFVLLGFGLVLSCTKSDSGNSEEVAKAQKLENMLVFNGIVGYGEFANGESVLAMRFTNKSGSKIKGFSGEVILYDDFGSESGREGFKVDTSVKYYSSDESDGVNILLEDGKSFVLMSRTWSPYFSVVSEELFATSGEVYPIDPKENKTKYRITAIILEDGTVLKK